MSTIRRLFTSALPALLLITAAPDDIATLSGRALASSSQPARTGDSTEKALSPEERMQRRFPQPVRVGTLIGRPLLDDDDNTIGYVQRVVRTSDGKIQLIVRYGGWFGWIGWWQRPVAVPIEVAAVMGQFVVNLDMPLEAYRNAPTWVAGSGQELAPDETIKMALHKR
jgi:hypothetical protein